MKSTLSYSLETLRNLILTPMTPYSVWVRLRAQKYILKIAILARKMSRKKINNIVIFVDLEHVKNVSISKEGLYKASSLQIKINRNKHLANAVKYVIENFLCTRLIQNTRRKWFWFKTSLSRKKLKRKLKKMSIIRKNKYFKNFKKIPNKKKMILKIREEILQSR